MSEAKAPKFMKEIVSSEQPSDALECLIGVTAFLQECLCTDRKFDRIELSSQATQGLYWVLEIIEKGMEEISESL